MRTYSTRNKKNLDVGDEYQTICPEFIAVKDKEYLNSPSPNELQLWGPSENVTDEKLEAYLQFSSDHYGYNEEQALGMLFFHKHKIDTSVADLEQFAPYCDDVWTPQDKGIFEQAFGYFGKDFQSIKKVLPHKTLSNIVQFYYTNKKSRSQKSLLDKYESHKKSSQEKRNLKAAEELSLKAIKMNRRQTRRNSIAFGTPNLRYYDNININLEGRAGKKQ